MGVGRRHGAAATVLSSLVLVVWSGEGARAEAPRAHTQSGATGNRQSATSNWQSGLLVARCAAAADLRAPNTDLARVKAERVARSRCSRRLREAGGLLPTASGQTVASALGGSLPASKLALLSLDTDQGSDGSVVVRMALAIDSLRARIFGADSPLPAASPVAGALIVDARDLKVGPAVGYAISDGRDTYRGPTLFFKSVAGARADSRVGATATLVRLRDMHSGVLRVRGVRVASLLRTRPLVVILYSERK